MAAAGTACGGDGGGGFVQDKIRGGLALPAGAGGGRGVSASAIFIRLAAVSAVAFRRCALGVALHLPFALLRRERLPRGRILCVGVASGWGWVRPTGSGSPRSTTRAWRRASFSSFHPADVRGTSRLTALRGAHLTALLRRHPRRSGGYGGHRGRR